MLSSITAAKPAATVLSDTDGDVVIPLPQTFSVEGATLGRQPNNDGDNSGTMWFE